MAGKPYDSKYQPVKKHITMIKEVPGNNDAGEQSPERAEIERHEATRKAIVGELKTLMDEEQELIPNPDTEASLNRLFEINRQEAVLINQLRVIEREIAAQKRAR